MPRPKQGYFSAAGHEVPATGDIVDRFMDGTGLKFWAYNQGKAGLPLFDRTALDVGSVIHGMIERDMVGAEDREIEFYLHERLAARMHIEMATASFRQYREWRQQNKAPVRRNARPRVRRQQRHRPDRLEVERRV